MVLLADEIPSSVANVFSPPFFAATDFVVADIEEPREATQDDGDIETENGKNEFVELGDDVGIQQNAIPTFVKGRKGLFEDPNTKEAIHPQRKSQRKTGTGWQDEGRKMSLSGSIFRSKL